MLEYLPYMEIAADALKSFTATMSKQLSAYRRTLALQATAFDRKLKKYAGDSVSSKGKSIRPMLVFASSWESGLSKTILNRACAVELIHLASLIHDDIIDNAMLRRNEPTMFKKYGVKLSLLLGDAIFAHAMSIMANDDAEIQKKGVAAVKTLCEGEIIQSIFDADKKTSFDDYYDIIDKKTAVLFKLACHFGGAACGDKKWALCAEKAGREMGMAYQIFDDICDWIATESNGGKTTGTDLLSGKRTLPILLLEKCAAQKDKKLLAGYVENCDSNSVKSLFCDYKILEQCKLQFDGKLAAAKKAVLKFDTAAAAKMAEFCDALSGLLV